jgi:hypothetical protein
MKTGRLLILLILLLLLAVPLALVLRNWTREAIVIPLLYLVWLGRLVLASIPQSLIWAVFLLAAAYIAVKSLSGRRNPPAQPRPESEIYMGRVALWARRIHVAAHGYYYRWNLANALGRLGLELSTYHARPNRAQRDAYHEIEKLAAPPEIQAYLQAGLTSPPMRSLHLFSSLGQWLRPQVSDSPLDLDPEKVIRFLEDQMGDQNDYGNRAGIRAE